MAADCPGDLSRLSTMVCILAGPHVLTYGVEHHCSLMCLPMLLPPVPSIYHPWKVAAVYVFWRIAGVPRQVYESVEYPHLK
jgi:hypothetical protein